MTTQRKTSQLGASLIEVLVAILILSFGLLSLGSMLSFSVQMPKLSGYRTTATNLASSHIEKIRANPTGYAAGNYISDLSYDATFDSISLSNCSYPNCSAAQLAVMDIAATERAMRAELPAGGMIVKCDGGVCGANSGAEIWVVWQEPDSSSALNPTSSDNCPTEVTSTYTSPAPRCLYIRFKV